MNRLSALAGYGLIALAVAGHGPARPAGPDDGAACVDDLYEPDDVRTEAKGLFLDQTQTHEHCDVDWVSLGSWRYPSLYAVETSAIRGGADTRLRLWQCTGGLCYGSYQTGSFTLAAVDHGGGEGPGASRLVVGSDGFSGPAAVEIVEEGDAYGPGKGYDVSLRCLSGCAGEPQALVVPAAAHVQGRNGAFFQTDLRLLNPGFEKTEVEIVFTTTGASPTRLRRRVTIAPSGLVTLPDVLATTFGLEQAAGWLEIRANPGEVFVTSRTSARRADGAAYGEFVPAVSFVSTAGSDTLLHLPHLAASAELRTNVAFCEITGGRTSVEVTLLDASGGARASRIYDLPAYGHRQIDDVFAALGVPGEAEGRITLRATTGGARIAGYATVIANRTGDFSYVPAAAPSGAAFLPVPPEGRTEVRVVNLESSTQTVRIRLLSTPGTPGREEFYVLTAGQTLAFDDAARTFGGAGVLLIVPARVGGLDRTLVSSSRTRLEDGTGVSAAGTSTSTFGNRQTVPFADGATSLGLFNPGPTPLSVTATIVEDGGATRALATYPVPAGAGLIASDLPGSPEDRLGTRLDLDIAPAGQLFAFCIRTDDLSRDGSLTAARPLYGYDSLSLPLPGGSTTTLFRVAPGPRFVGSPETERGRDADETRHEVTITSPYFIQRSETTIEEWIGVTTGQRAPRSSVSVSGYRWTDVTGPGGFLERLNAYLLEQRLPGGGLMRLPTEAEWEVASRRGSTARFPQGDLLGCDDDGCAPCRAYIGFPYCATPASQVFFGSFEGSVWEWVQDWYAPFGPEAQRDPTGPATGAERVIRGGAFDSPLRLCRSANRFSYPPDTSLPNVGFRIVMASPPPRPR